MLKWVKASEVGSFYDIALSWVLPVPARYMDKSLIFGQIVSADRDALIFTSDDGKDFVVRDLDTILVQDERPVVRQITLLINPDIEYDIKVIDQKTGKETDFDIIEDEKVSAE